MVYLIEDDHLRQAYRLYPAFRLAIKEKFSLRYRVRIIQTNWLQKIFSRTGRILFYRYLYSRYGWTIPATYLCPSEMKWTGDITTHPSILCKNASVYIFDNYVVRTSSSYFELVLFEIFVLEWDFRYTRIRENSYLFSSDQKILYTVRLLLSNWLKSEMEPVPVVENPDRFHLWLKLYLLFLNLI